MIRVILEAKASREVLDEVSLPVSLYEYQDGLELLGQLDNVSYDSFNPDQMPALIDELQRLMDCDVENARHYAAALRLAESCRDRIETSLTFTPFTD
ncbi:MAG: hypothetical protein K0Q55_1780 [Verrucomicrobia bacterium]|nr:hypothetical protein [Verrucomicrobiota bacterium]